MPGWPCHGHMVRSHRMESGRPTPLQTPPHHTHTHVSTRVLNCNQRGPQQLRAQANGRVYAADRPCCCSTSTAQPHPVSPSTSLPFLSSCARGASRCWGVPTAKPALYTHTVTNGFYSASRAHARLHRALGVCFFAVELMMAVGGDGSENVLRLPVRFLLPPSLSLFLPH